MIVKESTYKVFNEVLNSLLEQNFIINSKTDDNSEFVLQRESVQIDLTNLLIHHHRKETEITAEKFLKNTNDDELKQVFFSVLERLKDKQKWYDVNKSFEEKKLVLTDKEINKLWVGGINEISCKIYRNKL